MAKAKFGTQRSRIVNVGTSATSTTASTTLTAALTKVSADKGLATYVSYDSGAKASAIPGAPRCDEDSDEREEPRGVFERPSGTMRTSTARDMRTM